MDQTKPEARFTIIVDGIAVAVRYRANYFGEHADFEFTHPGEGQKPIPVSRTGYLSHFVHGSFVEAAGGPEHLAKAFCLAVLKQQQAMPPEEVEPATTAASVQPSLFD
jgi:hypothetical protein